MKTERIQIALSADVIFTPYTNGTQYSSRRDAKSNIERRMPGWTASISDVTGEGQITFSLSGEIALSDDVTALIVARGTASPVEMAVHNVRIECGDHQYDIDPVEKARSPEDTLAFLSKLAQNCGQA